MVDETEVPTAEVRETQTRNVRGGTIVLLIKRTVRESDGATIAAAQQDCVCQTGDEAGKLVAEFLSGH